MGILGAFSLISNDPRRFGSPVLLRNDEEERTCVFVDGPSLLYHVAVNDVYDESPPLTRAQIQQKNSIQQACPSTIYTRVSNFINSLLQVCEGNVHVVMDGLAPSMKQSTQVGRLRVMAIQGELHARKRKSSCKLLHLLAESSMVEALEDIMEEDSKLSLHQPPRGEAETFIDNWIRQHPSQSEQVFILSEDTDFFVYSSCPGFIPFQTLEFHVLDGKLSLSGFHYQRTKFVSAFFSREDDDDDRIMTTVAALAGCDYGMPQCICRVRTKMIQSDVGGLRPRLRNDPTSAAALTAILRFVSHWTRRCSDGSWLHAMIENLCADNEEGKRLMSFFEEIQEIYFPRENADSDRLDVFMSVDCRRLIECGVLYCRPLVETWDDKGNEPRRKSPPSRKRTRKSGKKRRQQRSSAVAHNDDCELEDVFDNPPGDTTPVPFPPTQAYVDQCLSSGSAWTVSQQVRCRLYGVLRKFAQLQHQDRRLKCHPTWSSPKPTVTEYMRVCKGDRVDYVPHGVSASAVSLPQSFDDAASDAGASVVQCILNKDQAERIILLSYEKQDWIVIMTSLMLPTKSALLLLLLSKSPELIPTSDGMVSNASDTETSSSRQDSLLLISVALFHAYLLWEVQHILMMETFEWKESPGERMAVSRILRYKVAEWIWKQMGSMDYSHNTDENESKCSNLLDLFFEQLKVSKMGGMQLNESEWQQWRDESERLWRICCQCRSTL